MSTIVEELKAALFACLIPAIEEATEKAVNGLKDNHDSLKNGFVSGFKSSDSSNTKLESIDTLDKSKLVEIAKKYIVSGATEVAAYKSETEDAYVVYLAYTNNRELLDADRNCYVIIKSNALAKDVAKLFGEEKLIILK